MANKAVELEPRPGSEPSPASSVNSATHSPSLERHRRKCTVCKHAERDAIEEAFLHWVSPDFITQEFELPDWSTLYRHAHATGLFAQRRRNVRFALENVIEHSDEVEITAAGLVRAVRAYASLTDSGEWVEPASRIIVSSGAATPGSVSLTSPATPSSPDMAPIPMLMPESSVVSEPSTAAQGHQVLIHCPELDTEITHTKQTEEVNPNRQ
ncbi:MAG: hypothetical protein ACRD4A_07290 [Candidatus Acidiferrales bacterium]